MAIETLSRSSISAAPPQDGAASTAAPKASIAFGLGWHVAEFFHFDFDSGAGQLQLEDSLPDIDQLSPRSRMELKRMQIAVALQRLGRAELGQEALDLELSADGSQAATAKSRLRSFHEQVLTSLAADDPALARSYDIGRTLSETALGPSRDDPANFARRFSANRVQHLKSELGDLRGRFPAHASEAVERTLDAWRSWLTEHKLDTSQAWSQESQRAVAQALQRQGQVWYALLIGDMDPSRFLTIDDYRSASRALLTALGELAWSFMSRVAARIGVAPWLIGIVIAGLLVLAAFLLKNLLFGVLSLAIFALIALGASVATMRGLLGQALQQVAEQLWQAELSNSMGHAVARLPQLPSRKEGAA